MFRKLYSATLLGCVLAGPLLLPQPASADADTCRDTLARVNARLARARALLLRACALGGADVDARCSSDPRLARRIAESEQRTARAIARACGGRDGICGQGGDDTPLDAVGWGAGTCPGALGAGCDTLVDDCGDLAACLACTTGAAAAGALEVAVGVATSRSPGAACRRAAVTAASRHYARRATLVARCSADSPCETARDDERSRARLRRSLCRACGDCTDPLPVADPEAAGCPDVTPPGSDTSCAAPVAGPGRIAGCIDCVTQHRADCAAAAAFPGESLAPECTHSAVCDPGFEGALCDRPRREVDPRFVGLADPEGWSTDAGSGRRYRRATRLERLRYGWQPGTFLVEAAGVRATAAAGDGPLQLAVPMDDGDVRVFTLALASRSAEQEMIEVSVEENRARATRTTPVALEYLSVVEEDGSFAGLLHLLAVEDGGATLRGVIDGRRIEGYLAVRPLELDPALATPTSLDRASLAPITVLATDPATAQGWNDCHGQGICGAFCANHAIQAPCSADAYNPCCQPWDPDGETADDCHDNFDNDQDGGVDHSGDVVHGGPADNMCVHTAACMPGSGRPVHFHRRESGMQYAFLGDVHYCTYLFLGGKDWRAAMLDRAKSVRNGFAATTGHAGWDGLPVHAKIRLVTAKCWILPTLEQARACKDSGGGDCAPFDAAPHTYPYAEAGNNSLNYIAEDNMQLDIEHAVQVGLTNPINMAQVVMATAKGEVMTGSHSPAVQGNTEGAWSVVRATDTYQGVPAAVSNHEFGHSLGLGHCTAAASPIDNECTVMGDNENPGGGGCFAAAPCTAPIGKTRFSPASATIVYGTVRQASGLPFQFGSLP